MRIGVGLPAAIPGSPGSDVGRWAKKAEDLGFSSVGVIDRLVYDNLDPIVALAAAAATTERVELITTVLNIAYRRNALVLAKQLASLDAVAAGRLTAGLGVGGWPEDHAAVGPSRISTGALMDEMVTTMRAAWEGSLTGASGPLPATPAGRPRVLFGGFAPAAFTRAARFGDGWVAPSFGYDQLQRGVAAVRDAFSHAARTQEPRVVVERYFSLGDDAAAHAADYLSHYYGGTYAPAVMADTVTTRHHLEREVDRITDAGCHNVVFLPCAKDPAQIELLARALDAIGLAPAGQDAA